MSLATSISASRPSDSRFDVAICWRMYPRVSGRPIFGFKDKLELLRLNAESFRSAIGNLKVKIWVLLDNCPLEYRRLLESIFPDTAIEFVNLEGEGNEATFSRQIDILCGQNVSDLTYFAEDDYLYLPGGIETAVEFMRKHSDVDFVTLYDHKDYHTKYVHAAAQVYMAGQHLAWYTAASTCLTFLARREALLETSEIFRTFKQKNSDLGLWLALTKHRLFNPWSYIRGYFDSPFVPASQCLSWRHAARQILFGKKRILLTPRPSLATHMEQSGLAPNIDWEKIFSPRLLAIRSEGKQVPPAA